MSRARDVVANVVMLACAGGTFAGLLATSGWKKQRQTAREAAQPPRVE